ncbi:hypothetical protein ERO13_A04G069226v2 [Gossypium hirsutum]|nr:hypothetical protein ERO13_A04G069226v2 [Gossypium hirsutum]
MSKWYLLSSSSHGIEILWKISWPLISDQTSLLDITKIYYIQVVAID